MQVTEILKGKIDQVREAIGTTKTPGDKMREAGVEALDATEFLTTQHREVDALFSDIDAAGDRALKSKEKLALTLVEKLTIHAKIEEKLFYPAVKAIDTDLVLEAAEEHEAIKQALARLKRTLPQHESFAARVTVLKELVQHHVKEEENDLFPKVKAKMGEEKLMVLGAKLQTMSDGLALGFKTRMPAKGKKRKVSNRRTDSHVH